MCNHCLNPACVAACPSGALYKREEDGLVLVDQDRCRGWRMCVSACPYKKVYFNWESGKSEKCLGCYPRVESGLPTVCSESCVGRIRYNGIMLYDADAVARAASRPREQDLYQAHLDLFPDPRDPAVIARARRDGVPDSWIEAAQRSPVYKLAVAWRVAFPMHAEFRTLPMVWYVPPLSPVQTAMEQGRLPVGADGLFPDVSALRIPLRYLANLLAAGEEAPIASALKKLIAMRHWQRARHVGATQDPMILAAAGLDATQAEEMYRYLVIADYEDRFVIPTSHQELSREDPRGFQGVNGLNFGNDSGEGTRAPDLFPRRHTQSPEPEFPLAWLPRRKTGERP